MFRFCAFDPAIDHIIFMVFLRRLNTGAIAYRKYLTEVGGHVLHMVYGFLNCLGDVKSGCEKMNLGF